jgi:hypothetical protein
VESGADRKGRQGYFIREDKDQIDVGMYNYGRHGRDKRNVIKCDGNRHSRR